MGDIMGVTINSRHQQVLHNVRQMYVAAEIINDINNHGNFKVADGIFIFHWDVISIHFN